jgi:glycosyltransferase involved in cell wall biosynthesis
MRLLGEELEKRDYTIIYNEVDPTSDIVCSMSYNTRKKALTAYRRKMPVIEYVHDIPAFRLMKIKWRIPYKVYANQLRKAQLVVAASKRTAIDLWNYFNIDSVVCYQHIDSSSLIVREPIVKRQQIIQISRFTAHKNFDTTIEALSRIKTVEGIFCGYGNPEKYKKLANDRGVSARFLRNASEEEVAHELASSRLLVSPSSFEGLGLTPIEALSVGVPVLLNDLDVFREIYGDRVIYHRNRDPIDMAEKIEMILRSPDRGQCMVEACKPIVEMFTVEAFADRFEKILQHALAY